MEEGSWIVSTESTELQIQQTPYGHVALWPFSVNTQGLIHSTPFMIVVSLLLYIYEFSFSLNPTSEASRGTPPALSRGLLQGFYLLKAVFPALTHGGMLIICNVQSRPALSVQS